MKRRNKYFVIVVVIIITTILIAINFQDTLLGFKDGWNSVK